jgi:hypothetical protein
MTVAAPVQHHRELVLSLILRRRLQIARFTARHAEKPIGGGFQRIRLRSEHARVLTRKDSLTRRTHRLLNRIKADLFNKKENRQPPSRSRKPG